MLSWLGNQASKVEKQVNPFDGGATYSNPNPQPRPQTFNTGGLTVNNQPNRQQVSVNNAPPPQAPIRVAPPVQLPQINVPHYTGPGVYSWSKPPAYQLPNLGTPGGGGINVGHFLGSGAIENFLNAPEQIANTVRAKQAGLINTKQALGDVGGALLNSAGWALPVGKGAELAKGTEAKLATRAIQGAKTFGKVGAGFGAVGGATSAMSQNASPLDIAKSAAISGAIGYGTGALTGGALPIAGAGARLAGKGAVKTAKAVQPKIDPALLQERNKWVGTYSNTNNPAIKSFADQRITAIDNQIAMAREGGFAKIPGSGAVGKNVNGGAGKIDPVVKAIQDENKFKAQIQNMRKQAPNDNHFYENTILNNVEAPGDVGNLARHIARRVEGGGEKPTDVLDEVLQPTNLKAEAAAQQSAHVQELKGMVRDLEKSTGQKGLYTGVLKNMSGMSEKQQLDYLAKSLTAMRDKGVLAMDYLNRASGFKPSSTTPTPPKIAIRGAVGKNVNEPPPNPYGGALHEAAKKLNLPAADQKVLNDVHKQVIKQGGLNGGYLATAEKMGVGQAWKDASGRVTSRGIMQYQKDNPGVPLLPKSLTPLGKNVGKPNVPEVANPAQNLNLSDQTVSSVPKGGLSKVPGSKAELPQAPVRTAKANASSAKNTTKVPFSQQKSMPKNFLQQPGEITKPLKDSTQRTAERITAEDRQKAQILGISAQRARTLRLRPPVPPELNGPVNDKLAGMPSPTREMPKTSAAGVGELPPMADLPTKNKLFSNKVNAIRKINTPSAHALADRIVNTESDARALRADWMRRIPTVQKLSNKETAQMFDAVEKKVPLKSVSPKVQQAVKEWRKLTPDIHKTGMQEGLLIGEQKNYVPHNYDLKGIEKNKSAYDSAIQYLMDTNQVEHNTATQLFKDLQAENARRPNRFGNFENARLTNMPGYAKDKQTLYNYIQGAAHRTAEARNLGTDQQVASKLLDNIRIEGGDVTSATKAVENYMRSADKGMGSAALREARGVFGAARLGKAAISHAGQTSNTAVDTGVARTTKAWGSYLSRNKSNSDFIAKTGVTNPQEIRAYQRQFTSVGTAAKEGLSRITAPGLNQMMKVNRSVTALAYRDYANHLASKGMTAKLRELGVKGNIGKTLTEEQQIQAARGGVDRTMFNPSRATTPIYAETPIGKTIGQYRTAYTYKQTGFIYDRVFKEAKKGNLAPLARYLGVSAVVGGGTIAVKNKISGRKEGIGGIALDTLGALGGIPGEALVQSARYGKKDVRKTAAGLIAPLAGEAVDVGGRLTQALQGKPQQLERYALGLTPFVGSRVASKVVPYPPGTNKAQVSQGAPQSQPGIYQVKAKDGSQAFTTLQGKNYKTFPTMQAAQQAQAKNEFKYSPQKTTTIGNTYYYKTAKGSVASMPKVQHIYDITTAKATLDMTNASHANDLQSWLKAAETKYNAIDAYKKTLDPATQQDKIDSLTTTQANLQYQAQGYQAKGYIRKGTTAKGTSSKTSLTKYLSTLKSANAAIKPPKTPAAPHFKVATTKLPASYKKTSLKSYSVAKVNTGKARNKATLA